jgi:hypothetical protein
LLEEFVFRLQERAINGIAHKENGEKEDHFVFLAARMLSTKFGYGRPDALAFAFALDFSAGVNG